MRHSRPVLTLIPTARTGRPAWNSPLHQLKVGADAPQFLQPAALEVTERHESRTPSATSKRSGVATTTGTQAQKGLRGFRLYAVATGHPGETSRDVWASRGRGCDGGSSRWCAPGRPRARGPWRQSRARCLAATVGGDASCETVPGRIPAWGLVRPHQWQRSWSVMGTSQRGRSGRRRGQIRAHTRAREGGGPSEHTMSVTGRGKEDALGPRRIGPMPPGGGSELPDSSPRPGVKCSLSPLAQLHQVAADPTLPGSSDSSGARAAASGGRR